MDSAVVEGDTGTNPLSRLRRQLSRRASPWQRGQVSSSFVTGRKKPPLSGKLFALAKASPFRERWHGEAVTERVASGTNPLSRLRRQLSRRGEPLAKRERLILIGQLLEESDLYPHKLLAFAKASPFRERWHGEAVTERVAPGTNPLSRLRRQLSRGGEPLAEPASFVHTGQRQKKSADKR